MQQLEYTLQKPNCHSGRISKMQSDTLEERYAIKLCFKLGKNDARETYGMLQTAFGVRAWPVSDEPPVLGERERYLMLATIAEFLASTNCNQKKKEKKMTIEKDRMKRRNKKRVEDC